MKVLLLDNYDSFTFNLLHILEQADGVEVDVVRNDRFLPDEVMKYDSLVLSPGPGLPVDAGIMEEIIRTCAGKKKILGVCLGHQAIAETFGARLKNLSAVRHGVGLPTIILDPPDPLFQNITSPFRSGRYHSWVVDPVKLPPEIRVTAIDHEDNIMAIRHVELPIWGVQFHPESILTEFGKEIIFNWLKC